MAADDVPTLHSRASSWFERNGDTTEAIRHALAAGDFDTAANLAELAIPAMRQERHEATIRGWLKVLPDEVIRVRPVLTVGLAGALLAVGELEGVEERLRDAERWLDVSGGGVPSAEMIVVDQAGFRSLPGAIAAYRAALAMAHGDVLGSVTQARRALDVSPEEAHLVRTAAAGMLGLASWTIGDLEAGYQSFAERVDGLRRIGHIADIFGCSIALADIRRTQGRLRDAMHTYGQALQLVGDQGGPVVRGTADMYVGMSEVYRERDDLRTASELLVRSQELGEHIGMPQNRYRWLVAMARVREAEGDVGRGAILEIVLAAACIGTAVTLFPVVKRQNESAAMGFVTARVMEAGMILVGVVSLLSVVTLKHDLAGASGSAAASLVTTGRSLVALHNWTFLVGPGLIPGVRALCLDYLLYRSRLVPRIIPTIGLIAAPIILASAVATIFGLYGQESAAALLAALPVAAWELSLGAWLVFKGFRPSPITAGKAPAIHRAGDKRVYPAA